MLKLNIYSTVYNYNKDESRNYDMRVTVSLAGHENFMTCLFMKHKNVAGDNYFIFLDIFLQGYTLSVQMDITEGKKQDLIKTCQLLRQLGKL